MLNPFMALLGAVALIIGGFVLLDFRPGSSHDKENISGDRPVQRGGWEEIFNRPAAIVFFTFLGLCLAGTLMLLLPGAMTKASIHAVSDVLSGGMIWFIVVLMLEVTQQIPARSIIFEATSAIATVGLSIGATAQFDQIGKLIIMLAMFLGRIGPLTLFMLLSDASLPPVSRCPDAKITIT